MTRVFQVAILLITAVIQTLAQQCPTEELLNFSAKSYNRTRLWKEFLEPLLIERTPGTQGHEMAKQHILNYADQYLPTWTVEKDQSSSNTPIGRLNFTNIVITERMNAPRKLVLAAHYDSKLFPGIRFIGATDSAAPCAMLMEIAYLWENTPKLKSNDVSLQLVFFDGEEAFVEWTREDSLYGSRHLASVWKKSPPRAQYVKEFRAHGQQLSAKSVLDEIDMFILLDLLGADQPWPTFHDYFATTSLQYSTLSDVEGRLLKLGRLSDKRKRANQFYFTPRQKDYMLQYYGDQLGVEDDHKPFHEHGVPILHLIPIPFPEVWHKPSDDERILKPDIIADLSTIIFAFISQNLGAVIQ